MNFLSKRLKENERLPKGYGVSYFLLAEGVAICHPIPLNWIVRGLMSFYWFLSFPKASKWENELREWGSKQFQEGFLKGRSNAYNEGYAVGVQIGMNAAAKMFQAKSDEDTEDLIDSLKPVTH
jgi:hypothetical protein